MVALSSSTAARCFGFLFFICCISTLQLSSLLEQKRSSKEDTYKHPRVLIFLTTHFSQTHIEFLQKCWPLSIANSQLLQNSDIFVFSTGPTNRSLLESLFANNKLEIYDEVNRGYQEGAILPLKLGALHRWFDHYDWVIRLNPDVIIKNDTEILLNIVDPNIDGIFINCRPAKTKLHTDWMAFRPSALPSEKFTSNQTNAEEAFTEDMHSILQSGKFILLPFSRPKRPGYCRVIGDVVVHLHDYVDVCETDLVLFSQ